MDGDPVGGIRRPLVHLELDGDDLLLIGALHGVGVCREGDGGSRLFFHGDGVHFAVHQQLERDLVRRIGVKIQVFFVLIGGDVEGDFVGVPVIGGREGLHRVFQQGGDQGDIIPVGGGDGLVVHLLGRVAEKVGDAGVCVDTHGEGAGVDLLDLVQQGDELAIGGGVEFFNAVVITVDFDGFVRHLDVLVRSDGDGDEVAALVRPRRCGDGEGGVGVIVYQGDGDVGGIARCTGQYSIVYVFFVEYSIGRVVVKKCSKGAGQHVERNGTARDGRRIKGIELDSLGVGAAAFQTEREAVRSCMTAPVSGTNHN